MILTLVLIELKKYKRTAIPWMIAAGGSLPAGVAIFVALTDYQKVNWDVYTVKGLDYMNILALLLVAVFTGFVFAGENTNNIDNILFTYPVARIKFFISKFIVILFFTFTLYLSFSFFTMLFGVLGIGSLPDMTIIFKLLEISLLLSAVQFVLVPVTMLFIVFVKGAATCLFAGMAYFVFYISFFSTEISLYIPVCMPDKLAAEYFNHGVLSSSDITSIAAICAIVFLSAVIIGAGFYLKQDVGN